MRLRVRCVTAVLQVALGIATGPLMACAYTASSPTPTPSGKDAIVIPTCAPNAPTMETAADSNGVDRQAIAQLNTLAPKYPPSARERDIQGAVLLAFVVDTLGRVEMCTVSVLASADPLLTQAVLDVLPRSRFFPAERQGRKVPQRLKMAWDFRY